jgi:hypothetical protein
VGAARVSEVAAELACDRHAVNDAVITYGEALLEADRKRLNRTTAIGLDETSFVRLSSRMHTDYATTVADVENHQIIENPPDAQIHRRGGLDRQATQALEGGFASGPSTCRPSLRLSIRSCCPPRPRWSTNSTSSRWPTVPGRLQSASLETNVNVGFGARGVHEALVNRCPVEGRADPAPSDARRLFR